MSERYFHIIKAERSGKAVPNVDKTSVFTGTHSRAARKAVNKMCTSVKKVCTYTVVVREVVSRVTMEPRLDYLGKPFDFKYTVKRSPVENVQLNSGLSFGYETEITKSFGRV